MTISNLTEAAMNMNNIVLKHNGHTISIAQHKDREGRTIIQEILVFGPNVDDEILHFGSNPNGMIEALKAAIEMIDKEVV